MKHLLTTLLMPLLFISCNDYSYDKEIITENLPKGHIDSLSNEVINNFEIETKT